MNIHEHQAKEILKEFGAPVSKGVVIHDINEIQEKVYDSLFDWLVKDSLDGDLYVYLRADYMTCDERIKKRARSEESQVPLELLKTLEEKHDDWLLNMKENCIVIDTGNITEDDYEAVIKGLVQKINQIR